MAKLTLSYEFEDAEEMAYHLKSLRAYPDIEEIVRELRSEVKHGDHPIKEVRDLYEEIYQKLLRIGEDPF